MSRRSLDNPGEACYMCFMPKVMGPGGSLFAAIGRLPSPLRRLAIRGLNGLGLRLGGYDANMRKTFTRILAFQGRPASEDALDGLMRAFKGYYVGSLENLSRLCASGIPPKPPVPVALTALPLIKSLREKGTGVILATPHFGDLYSSVLALAEAGVPLTVLMVGGDQYHWAESENLKFVEFLGGAADVVAALRANGCVLVYDDVDFVPGNRTADFFGAPAFPPPAPRESAAPKQDRY